MVVEQARAALSALYTSHREEERLAADEWLRGFATQEGAWQRLMALLTDPAASEHEQFYAATALRPLAQRQKEPVQPDAAPVAVQQLAKQYAAAAAAGNWAVANPLAAALAAVAVRTTSWPAEQLVPQLLALLQSTLQKTTVLNSNGSYSSSSQLAAAVHLLSALAEAACSLDISMHPQRREAAKTALAAASEPLTAVQQALSPATAVQLQVAALQLVQAWCALGPAPAGAEAASGLLRHMHHAALDPALGSDAAEAVAALYGSCCLETAIRGNRANSSGSNGSSEQQRQRQRVLLGMLCGMLSSFATALQQALSQAQGASSQQARLLNAALSILGAAAKAADSQAQLGTAGQQSAADAVQLAADVALLAMQHPEFDVVLAALQHWDEQLERWKALCGSNGSTGGAGAGRDGAACSPQQRHALLGQLCSALLQRMALPPHLPAARLTADARDLPDDMQQVRREVADTFRSATECLGLAAARQQLLQLAQQAQASWQAGSGWQEYECALYALNLVWAKQRGAQPDAACVAEVQQAAALVAAALQPGVPKLAGTALTLLGGMAEQLPLLDGSQQQPQQPQQAQQAQQAQQSSLPHLLSLLVQLLQRTDDDKLSRNAATCCSRLAAHRPLAALLVARHPSWSDALCGCFAAAASRQQQHMPLGDRDQPTSQFLITAICHLAAASADADLMADGRQAASSQRGSQLLQQLLSKPAAAAEAALAAAAVASSGEERQQALDQAAVHIETIAVAVEAAAGSSSCGVNGGRSSNIERQGSRLAEQLLAVLAGLAGVLQQATAAAAESAAAQLPGEPLLLQALCRVAAATAPTRAAALGLQLLHPFAAAAPHPCVLQGFTSMASSNYLEASMQQLQQAASQCTQASAAQHADDAHWQPALLQLGEACLRHLPAVAADTATLDALLVTAQHSMRSYDRTVCEQAVGFAEVLCCMGRCVPADAGAAQDSAAAAAQQHLQQRLDGGGLGTALVLGLLLAAAGAMPPYMVIVIADALHRVWRAVGSDRFAAWLRGAALESAPQDAAWRRWKQEAQQAAVADLLSPQCAQDVRRFKRLLKVMTGGKKKGQRIDQPARSC